MNTLPGDRAQISTSVPTGTGTMAKEAEPVVNQEASAHVIEIGNEVELSREVSQAGVSLRSDSVQLPEPISRLGVAPVGSAPAPPVAASTTLPLPLSDDQIATGLHQSIVSSWRWLAQWCIRQLQSAHITIKRVHGAFVRVKE